jgi:hypothetical protein
MLPVVEELNRSLKLDKPSNALNFFLVRSNHSPSLNIADSDHIGNLLYMQHLVGTLVKYQSSGNYRPSLAERWTVSDDQKIWSFSLRDGIQCEDGVGIDGDSFRKSLISSLKRYSKRKHPPVFDKLEGWNSFVANKNESDLGVFSLDKNNITFKFTTPIRGGLLEFLGMPYFGYICASNFKEDGTWSDKNRIISSGPYKLKKFGDGNNVVLEKRKEWFSFADNSPDTVYIKNLQSFEQLPQDNKKTIFDALPRPDDLIPSGFTQIHEVPSTFLPVVLLPHAGSLFEDDSTRQLMRDLILSNKEFVSFSSKSYQLNDSFYPIHGSKYKTDRNVKYEDLKSRIKRKIRIRSYASPIGNNIIYIEALLKKIFDGAGVEYEIDNSPVTNTEDWYKKDYDIRILGVDIGGGIENWVIRMMFCSELGVRFPDPSGRICGLVDKFDSGTIPFESYIDLFNRSIFEDASVVPIMHGGRSWFLSEDIPTTGISPVMGLPRFEDLSLE